MRRGDIVLVHFPFSSGTGGKVRPAVVVQADAGNRKLGSVIVAMITSTTRLAGVEPTQLLVDPLSPDGRQSGLLHRSAIKCENLFTIEQTLVIRVIGSLAPKLLSGIDTCLKSSLGLT